MDAVIGLCVLNLLLCIWIVRLQSKISKMNIVLAVMSEGMARVADGEVEIVRTAEGIKAVVKKGA